MLELLPIAVDIARVAEKAGVSSFIIEYKYYPAFDDIPEGWWIEIINDHPSDWVQTMLYNR